LKEPIKCENSVDLRREVIVTGKVSAVRGVTMYQQGKKMGQVLIHL
jgi:hypothetical protein